MKGNKSKLTPVAAAVSVLVTMASMPAHAQDAGQQVTVTGIRASLQNAVNIKRNSTAVVDAVSAEDVGKLPDSDVGEALGRIPGISVGRAFGQGSSVSVRGSDPQMTYTTLNGQTVASTGWYDQVSVDRSFNYSLLPSELIGGIEVYKSSQADLTEGGIGGTVIVKTRKPLDQKPNTVFASIGAGRGTVSDEWNKDVAGLYSWRTAEKTFGVLVGAAWEKGDYVRRGTEANLSWNGDIAPATFIQQRERTAFNLNAQVRPVAGLTLGANLVSMKLTGDNLNSAFYIFQSAPDNDLCTQLNAAGACVKSEATATRTNPRFAQTWARKGKMTSDTLSFDLNYKGNGFKVDGVIGATRAKGGTDVTANYGYGWWSPGGGVSRLPIWTGTIDATGKEISISPTTDQSVDLSDLPSVTELSTWSVKTQPNKDKEHFAQADLTLDLDWGVLNSFKTGFRVANHEFEKSTRNAQFPATVSTIATSGLYSGTQEIGPGGWAYPKPNLDAMANEALSRVSGWAEDRSAYAKLKEDNKALYGMFSFEKDDLSGNFGARWIRTDVGSDAYAFDGTTNTAPDVTPNGFSKTVSTAKASYTDVLPSFNLAVKLRNDLTMRFTAASTLNRPNFDNMFGANVGGYNDDQPNNLRIAFGNAGLKPMKSAQMDLGLEYYYGKGNLMSVMYFHKDINNFITTQTQANQAIGVSDPRTGEDNWTVARFVNAGGGKIDGIETQINHNFGNGFGVVANYTFADATAPKESYADEINVFTASSKHNANLVGYWENETYSARLAYNWRSKYMVRETGYYGNRWHDAFGTLDANVGWNITSNLRLQFEANNLTKQNDVQYGAAAAGNTSLRPALQDGYPAWSFIGERTFKISLSGKF